MSTTTPTKLTEAQYRALKTVLAGGGEHGTSMGRLTVRGDVTVRYDRKHERYLCINRKMEENLLKTGLLEQQWMLRDEPLSESIWGNARYRTHFPVVLVTAAGCRAVDEYERRRAAKE